MNIKGFKSGMMLCLGGAALALLVFGPRASSEAIADDVVVVDYWEKWTGDEESQMRQIVDDFNSTVGKEKRIFVRYLSTSNVTQKTLVSTAGGVPPDIAGLFSPNLGQFAAQDALEPLDDLAAEYGITAETYKPVFWESCKYEGKLYALVSTPYNVALHYNAAVFQENAAALQDAGLDPNRPPASLAELDAYAAALNTFDSRGGIVRAGYLPLEPGWYLDYTCLWFGGMWWDDATQTFNFMDPAVVKSYEWIQSYSHTLGTRAMSDFRTGAGTYDSPQNPFLVESVAMVQQGTFMANVLNRVPAITGRWAVAPFPSAVEGLNDVTYCTADVFVIPRGARHKREAFEFIAYVNRQEVMEKLCQLHCKISPLAEVSESFYEGHRNPYIRTFEALALSPNAYGTPIIPILPEVGAELTNFVQQLTKLEVTPEEGLQHVQATVQKKYDVFLERQAKRRARAGQ